MTDITLSFGGSDIFTGRSFSAVLSFDPDDPDDIVTSFPGSVEIELDGSFTLGTETFELADSATIILGDATTTGASDTIILNFDTEDGGIFVGTLSASRDIIDGMTLDLSAALADLSSGAEPPTVSFFESDDFAAIELDRFALSGGSGSDDDGDGGGGGSGTDDDPDDDDDDDDPDDGTGGPTATGTQTIRFEGTLDNGLRVVGSATYDASAPLEDDQLDDDEAAFQLDGTVTVDGTDYTLEGTLLTGNSADLTDDDAVDDEVQITGSIESALGSGLLQILLESDGDVTSDDGLREGIGIDDFDKSNDFILSGPFSGPGFQFGALDRFEFAADDGGGGGGGGGGELGQGLTVEQARTVARLYEAGLDRDGNIDTPGLNFWIDVREDGASETALARAFIDSPEFSDSFGEPETLTNRQLVEVLYQNVLDRPGEEAGVDFWTGRVDDPAFSRADLLLAFAKSPENVAGTPLVENLTEVSPGEWDFVVA